MKKILTLFIFILFSLNVSGAYIHGVIYDTNLDKINNAVIEVDSIPKQRILSVNGSYSLFLPPGDYTISAKYYDEIILQNTKENISIIDDGEYIIDLFLFIDISIEEKLMDEYDFLDIESPYKTNITPYIIGLLVFILVITLIFLWIRNNDNDLDKKISQFKDNDIEKILILLEKNHGRLTQKEIRKEIPLSEAKISLMISELEKENKIKRIKKGRGNIIILQ